MGEAALHRTGAYRAPSDLPLVQMEVSVVGTPEGWVPKPGIVGEHDSDTGKANGMRLIFPKTVLGCVCTSVKEAMEESFGRSS